MMGNKFKIAKCPLRTKQTGHTLKSTQNTYIGNENLSQKKISTLDTSQAKPENSRLTFSPSTDKQYSEKDSVRVQKEISPTTSNIRKIINTTGTCPVAKQKPCKKKPHSGDHEQRFGVSHTRPASADFDAECEPGKWICVPH